MKYPSGQKNYKEMLRIMESAFLNKKNNIYRMQNINNICVSLFFCARLIVLSLPNSILFDNILALFLFGILIVSLINNEYKFNVIFVYLAILILLSFSITFLISGLNKTSLLYLMYFLIYGGTGMYLSDKDISFENVYRYILIISVFLLPFIYYKDISANVDLWMGFSYSILPVHFSGIIYIFSNHKFRYKTIVIFLLLIYVYLTMSFFTRGALLATILFIILFFTIRNYKPSLKRNSILLIMLTLLWILYINLEKIFALANSFLMKREIHIRFIEKTLHLLSTDNLLNGRNLFFELALKGIYKSPIFGNGIGSFESQTGLIYTHNLFLQLLYEGGVFFLLPCILILFYAIYLILIKIDIEYEVTLFLLFIFSLGVFRLFVSSVYWGEPIFWFLIGFILLKKKPIKE